MGGPRVRRLALAGSCRRWACSHRRRLCSDASAAGLFLARCLKEPQPSTKESQSAWLAPPCATTRVLRRALIVSKSPSTCGARHGGGALCSAGVVLFLGGSGLGSIASICSGSIVWLVSSDWSGAVSGAVVSAPIL